MPRLPMSLLSRVEVATPCKADWESMSGDDKKRFCSLCKLHVHNLSAMSEAEAEAFVRQAEVERAGGGRVCVRFYRRADGTVLTQDCPVGVAARVRRRVVAVRGAMVALVAMIGGGAFADGVRPPRWLVGGSMSVAQARPFSDIRRLLRGIPPVPRMPPGGLVYQGDFAPRRVVTGAMAMPTIDVPCESPVPGSVDDPMGPQIDDPDMSEPSAPVALPEGVRGEAGGLP